MQLCSLCALKVMSNESNSRILTDLDAPRGAHLMGPNEEGSLGIVTLLLTGRATPYLHNGVVYVGDEDHYALPQFGILSRATIGLLILGADSEISIMVGTHLVYRKHRTLYPRFSAHLQHPSKQPGSRLKTPALPVWVTCCGDHFGVLFNSNRELLRNYHAEKRFDLHYYTCAGCYLTMTVDNRTHDESPLPSMVGLGVGGSGVLIPGIGGGLCSGPSVHQQSASGADSVLDSVAASPLERLIHTKWPEGRVTFKGPAPASMSY